MTVKIYDNEDGSILAYYQLVQKITYKYNECGQYTNVLLDCGTYAYHLTIHDADAYKITIKLEV